MTICLHLVQKIGSGLLKQKHTNENEKVKGQVMEPFFFFTLELTLYLKEFIFVLKSSNREIIRLN